MEARDAQTDGGGEQSHDHRGDVDAADIDTVDEPHDNSWSVNLEKPNHAESRELVIAGAIQAVEHTDPGTHVTLVTHGEHGHPEGYLYDHLEEAFDDIDIEYVEQRDGGGHVTRINPT